MNFKFITMLIILLAVSVFIIQNAEVVDMRFMFWKISMSRSLMFVFLMLTGIAIGWFLRGHMIHKKAKNAIREH